MQAPFSSSSTFLTNGGRPARSAHDHMKRHSPGQGLSATRWGEARTDPSRTVFPTGHSLIRLPPADGQVDRIVLRRLTAEKRPTSEFWRSDPQLHRNWVLEVVSDGHRLDPDRSGSLHLDRASARQLELYASDSWSSPGWFRSGEQYEVEVIPSKEPWRYSAP